MYINEFQNISLSSQNWLTKRQNSLLKLLNLNTVFDLLNYYPFRYDDRSNIESIQKSIIEKRAVTTVVTVIEHKFIFFNKKRHPKILIQDKDTRAFLIGFNRPFLKDSLKVGEKYWLNAHFTYKYNEIQASSFDFQPYKTETTNKKSNFGKIIPFYKTTENLYLKELRKLIQRCIENYVEKIDDEIPDYLLKQHHLTDKKYAIQNIHFPKDKNELNKSKLRLAFEEFFSIQLAVSLKRKQIESFSKIQKYTKSDLSDSFNEQLPYNLTNSQKTVINEIKEDMCSQHLTHRLIQGDVGSGKTIVALSSMIFSCENGYQSVLMVPTEVLAVQHYLNIIKLTNHLNIKCVLLTGSLNKEKKEKIYHEIQTGEAEIIIGTHALIQENVIFHQVGLVVIDEQHKFGVQQRAQLKEKAGNVDLLVMTATPIPRTLTLTLYGDLDVSIIDELPANRQTIKTHWIEKEKYRSMLEFIKKELDSGRQAFFIYPLIDNSENIESRTAIEMHKILTDYYKEYQVGLIHGRMKSDEKESIMADFSIGKLNILVSTTVIEVGIDVPNATIIVIENSERFGLSQLHQLRGRVGRGQYQSYCFLVTGENETEDTIFRMKAMVKHTDGFIIAEEDLKLRGPGEILGFRQSGLPELKIADYFRDEKLLLVAKKDSEAILDNDLSLSKNKNIPLKEGIVKYFPDELLSF